MRNPKKADDAIRRSMNEIFLKSSDAFFSQQAADEITYAFAAFTEAGFDYIPDERTLPYPKEVIRQAFRKRISYLIERCRKEPNNAEHRKDLELHRTVAIFLSDFQRIDPEDDLAVQAANEWYKQLALRLSKLGTDEEKHAYMVGDIKSDWASTWERSLLKSKYLKRAIPEEELLFDDPRAGSTDVAERMKNSSP